jgi:hypothetical protein
MKNRKNTVLVGGLLAAAAVSSSASAATVIADVLSVNPGSSLTYTLEGGPATTTLAGVFNWNRTGGTFGPEIGAAFNSFCIELTQTVQPLVSVTFDVIPLENGPLPGSVSSGGLAGMGVTKASNLKKLWAEYYDDALLSNNNAAAFQTAVWEIVYDPALDLASGDFQAVQSSPGVYVDSHVPTAVTWLSSLAGLTVEANLAALTNDRWQDQVVVVPEPTLGGLIMLSALAGYRRRRA